MKVDWNNAVKKAHEVAIISCAVGFTVSALTAQSCISGKDIFSAGLYQAACHVAKMDPK